MATDTSQNPTPENNLQTGGSSAFLSSIQSKLLDQSGIISSTNSNLQDRLNSAMTGVKESADSSNKAIESQFGRELGYTQEKANNDMISGRAAGSGGLLNIAALRELTQTTDKSLKDLEQRKQELILQNNSAAASKIADMQIQALDFQQKAQQQTFSNLMGMANYGLQAEQNQLAKSNQVFTQNKAMSDIALQYGIKLNPGDTIDSVTSRAMPFASKEQQMQLAKLQSEINKNNAEVTKTLKEGASFVTAGNLDTIAQAAAINPAVLSTIKNPSDLGKVVVKMNEIQKNNAINQIDYNMKTGVYKTLDAGLKDVTTSVSNGTLNPAYANDAMDYVKKNFKAPVAAPSTSTSFWSSSFVKNILPAMYVNNNFKKIN